MCTGDPVSSFTWRADSSRAGFSSMPAATAMPAERKPIQRLRSDSCDSASSAEASDSDDDAPFAKKKCPASRLSSHQPVAAARPSTKYSIWGSVLQEQTLAKDLSGWFGMNSKVISDRDVETYDYRKAKNSAENNGTADPVDVDVVDDCEELPEDNDDVNICDRETFGTSTSTTTSSKRTKSSERNCSDDERFSRKRRRNGTMIMGSDRQPEDVNRLSARNRISRRTYDRDKDRSHVRVGVNDAATDVADELVRLLEEPEHMKETFGNFADKIDVNLLITTIVTCCLNFNGVEIVSFFPNVEAFCVRFSYAISLIGTKLIF